MECSRPLNYSSNNITALPYPRCKYWFYCHTTVISIYQHVPLRMFRSVSIRESQSKSLVSFIVRMQFVNHFIFLNSSGHWNCFCNCIIPLSPFHSNQAAEPLHWNAVQYFFHLNPQSFEWKGWFHLFIVTMHLSLLKSAPMQDSMFL